MGPGPKSQDKGARTKEPGPRSPDQRPGPAWCTQHRPAQPGLAWPGCPFSIRFLALLTFQCLASDTADSQVLVMERLRARTNLDPQFESDLESGFGMWNLESRW